MRPLPVAEESAGEVLSLPMFPHMSDGRVARVCDAIRNALGTKGSRGEPAFSGRIDI